MRKRALPIVAVPLVALVGTATAVRSPDYLDERPLETADGGRGRAFRDVTWDRAPDSAKKPWTRFVATHGGTWVILWGHLIAGSDWQLEASWSTNGGSTWSAPATVFSTATTTFGEHHIGVDARGTWVITGVAGDPSGGDTDVWVVRSSDPTVGWSAPVLLDPTNDNTPVASTLSDRHPHTTVSPAGRSTSALRTFPRGPNG